LLQFKYRGIINSYELGGLFYTYYDDIQQTRHWMVATHMETGVHARSLFPCLDEPAYKAIFHMTIIYPKPLIALSNMMERPYVELHDPWVVVRFPPTPKLSTYLVAMAVGPYVSKSITNKAGTLVRFEEYLGFAATVAGKCLDSLGEYVNFPFPLSKSDQLGLPKFPAGAVENMGLLQSIQVKQKAAGVICHELAHQWFGDLVTMTWWPELVVNEGFANYFEIYNQAMAFPEHAQFLDGKFFTDMMEPALDTDAIINASHPIIARGLNFDKIVYDKGASIYRMAHITLGDKAWQEGLTDYIHSYKWGNANHEMLFAKLTKAAQAYNIVDWCGRPMDVAKFLDPWFLQQCFPLITVTNNQLMAPAQFTQQPFDKRTLLPASNFSYSWPVPMHIRDYKGDHKSILHWLKPS
uniref:Peptidase_M1 domain-containing protein n=1 Tax=Anisakis simplex TaxID=6269 RepID=A0A0M3KC89_ANISI